jgi:hypothetical protein
MGPRAGLAELKMADGIFSDVFSDAHRRQLAAAYRDPWYPHSLLIVGLCLSE